MCWPRAFNLDHSHIHLLCFALGIRLGNWWWNLRRTCLKASIALRSELQVLSVEQGGNTWQGEAVVRCSECVVPRTQPGGVWLDVWRLLRQWRERCAVQMLTANLLEPTLGL